MKYPKPQTVYVRASEENIAQASEMDTKPAPRMVPRIWKKLQAEIAGQIEIHDYKDGTKLFYLLFAWPTHDETQDVIRAFLDDLITAGTAWAKLDTLPKQDIEVTEMVVDAAKPKVDGRDQLKAVQVMKPTATHAAKFCFVGDVRATTVEVKPVVEAIEK
jgi:hypothetical protein